MFARFGIPKIVISDNVPFNSAEFIAFSREWDFNSHTISPHHSQSNGLAEKAVGIVKNMLDKATHSKQDIQLYILNYRNSPVAGLMYSPAQLLLSKNLRSKLPIHDSHLYPKVVNDPEVINKSKQSLTYDKSSLQKAETFSVNDDVLIQNVKSKLWERGVECLDNRSYLVKMCGNDKLFRRNVHFIKKFNHSLVHDQLSTEEEVTSEFNYYSGEDDDTSLGENNDTNSGENIVASSSEYNDNAISNDSVPNCSIPLHHNDNGQLAASIGQSVAPGIVNRSAFGRVIKKPNRLNFTSIRAELRITISETIIEQLQSAVAPLIDKIKELETIVLQQREKIDRIERKRNVMVFNYEEKETENWETLEEAMLNLFKEELGVDCRVEDLDECVRVGRKGDGKIRPIKIGFTSYKKKLCVLRNKKKLKGTKTSITEDYSKQVRERRRAMVPIVNEIKERGEFAEIRYDKLFTSTKESNPKDVQKPWKRKKRT
ncbi:hypothetical protein WDU94_015558 [Cyamophila willieti]